MFLALKKCMNVSSGPDPQELYSSKHMDMSPTPGGSVSHTQYLVYLSDHIAMGLKNEIYTTWSDQSDFSICYNYDLNLA